MTTNEEEVFESEYGSLAAMEADRNGGKLSFLDVPRDADAREAYFEGLKEDKALEELRRRE